MTSKQRNAWLKAIKELELYYKGEIDLEGGRCPLCDVVDKLYMSHLCYQCLWYQFEGMHCDNYARRHFKEEVIALRDEKNSKWIKDSLKRLNKWKKLLKERKGD